MHFFDICIENVSQVGEGSPRYFLVFRASQVYVFYKNISYKEKSVYNNNRLKSGPFIFLDEKFDEKMKRCTFPSVQESL